MGGEELYSFQVDGFRGALGAGTAVDGEERDSGLLDCADEVDSLSKLYLVIKELFGGCLIRRQSPKTHFSLRCCR